MNCKLYLAALALIAAAAPSQQALSQTTLTYIEDFEGEFPGPQAIWGGGFSFHGGGLADPPVVEEVASTGFNSTQSYQVTVDGSSNAGSYWYYGLGSFLRFSAGDNDGAAQGQTGEDNPANFTVQFDLKVTGANVQVPVRGEVVLYKPDYEVVNSIDFNADGDMLDGADIRISGYGVPAQADNYTNWHHVSLNLAQLNPATAQAGVPAPFFDDESTFVFRAFWDGGEYGTDAGNVIQFDNVALVFTPPAAGQPGDFNGSGKVDGDDFLLYQRGGSPNGLNSADLTTFRNNYDQPPIVGAISAVPEPASAALLVGAVAMLGLAARRRTS